MALLHDIRTVPVTKARLAQTPHRHRIVEKAGFLIG